MRCALLLLAALAACTARPTASEVATRARELGGAWPPLAAELRRRGWEEIRPGVDAGGPGAGLPACLERAVGGALTGVDVARACGDADDRVAGVWRMHTHGRDWERVEVAP